MVNIMELSSFTMKGLGFGDAPVGVADSHDYIFYLMVLPVLITGLMVMCQKMLRLVSNVNVAQGVTFTHMCGLHFISLFISYACWFLFRTQKSVHLDFNAKICSNLAEYFAANGWFNAGQRKMYCDYGCEFADLKCDEDVPMVDLNGILDIFNRTDDWFDSEDGDEIDEPTYMVICEYCSNMIPVLLTLVPLMMHKRGIKSFWSYFGVMLFYLSLYPFIDQAFIVCAAGYCIAAYTFDLDEGVIQDVCAMWGTVLFVFCMLLFNNVIVHFAFVFSIVALYCFMIYSVFIKDIHHSRLVLFLSSMMVVMYMLRYAREFNGINSIGTNVLAAFLNCITPQGESKYFLKNSMRLTRSAVELFQMYGVSSYNYGLVHLMVQFICFIVFRGFLGGSIISALRYKCDVVMVIAGFYVYMSDLFGPCLYLRNMILGYEGNSSKRMLYAIVFGTLGAYEYLWAYDFFIARVLWSLADWFIFKTAYGRVSKFLSVDINFCGMYFAPDGSFPWEAVSKILGYRHYIVSMERFVDRAGGGVSCLGYGFVINGFGHVQSSLLYTAQHVVGSQGNNQVIYADLVEGCTEVDGFRRVGDVTDDPVVKTEVNTSAAANISVLVPSELMFVEHLFCLRSKREASGAELLAVPEFNIKDGRLHCIVEANYGDSGAPCFAVLKTGQVRYAGCVSKGGALQGGGNIISLVCTDQTHDSYLSDSSDESGLYEFNPAPLETTRVEVLKAIDERLFGYSKAYDEHLAWFDRNKEEVRPARNEGESDNDYAVRVRKRWRRLARNPAYRDKQRNLGRLESSMLSLMRMAYGDEGHNAMLQFLNKRMRLDLKAGESLACNNGIIEKRNGFVRAGIG